MRILSVDDNTENLYLIEVIGRTRGHEVASAHNGSDALEQMAQGLPDLIISDILMPKMDGFQFCHEVKSHERSRHVPFIFYTATYTSKQDEELAISLGASRFIVKPMDPEQLAAVMEDVVREAQRGQTAVPEPGETNDYLKTYNSRLVRKLDSKIEQLEAARLELREMLESRDAEIAQRQRSEEERGRLEAQFLQAQKLESVGRLAGGIAHDFNNLLTVINGYCEMLLLETSATSSIQRKLREIRTAGERAAKLTKQLLAFSRRQTIDVKPVNPARAVEETRAMIQRLVGDDVEVVTKLSSERLVRADEGQLHQVLLNLVVNARDAMPHGGKLTLATADVDADAISATEGDDIQPGPHVLLSVADSGTGMSRETLERIFEPFYTTKGEGEGTGLGLSTVYGIVRQNGGCIRVESEPGVGSRFLIYLPSTHVEKVVIEAATAPAQPSQGKETILVVDDHANVRALMVSILSSQGYNVLQAATGAEALALAECHLGAIDLLISDVKMPRMNGPELAKLCRVKQPRLRVLFASGYAAASASDIIRAEPGVSSIGKPFTPNQLAAKVRELLDGAFGDIVNAAGNQER